MQWTFETLKHPEYRVVSLTYWSCIYMMLQNYCFWSYGQSLRNGNRKSYALYRTVTFPMTSSDLWRSFRWPAQPTRDLLAIAKFHAIVRLYQLGHKVSSFLACNSRLCRAIRRHHPPQRAVLSQICCFRERKVVLFQILLDCILQIWVLRAARSM